MNEFILRRKEKNSNSNKRSRNATMELNFFLFFLLVFFFFFIKLTFLDTHFSSKFACNHNNIDLGSFVSSFLLAIFLFLLQLLLFTLHYAISLFPCVTLFSIFSPRILAVFMRFIRSRSHYAQLHTIRNFI